MEWYSNPWVIGIIGSIPGGIFVNWATGKILGRRENREYLQKVIGANREVVYAIRPGVAEGQIPSTEVLLSLINATARRYGVEPHDLYTPVQMAEELVKEVMDSSFISALQKHEYCARLSQIGIAPKEEIAERENAPAPRAIAEYRQRLITSMSMLLGLLTVSMTVVMSLFEIIRSKQFPTDEKGFQLFIPMIAAMGTMTLTVVAFAVYRDLMRRRERDQVHIDAEFVDPDEIKEGNLSRLLTSKAPRPGNKKHEPSTE